MRKIFEKIVLLPSVGVEEEVEFCTPSDPILGLFRTCDANRIKIHRNGAPTIVWRCFDDRRKGVRERREGGEGEE